MPESGGLARSHRVRGFPSPGVAPDPAPGGMSLEWLPVEVLKRGGRLLNETQPRRPRSVPGVPMPRSPPIPVCASWPSWIPRACEVLTDHSDVLVADDSDLSVAQQLEQLFGHLVAEP